LAALKEDKATGPDEVPARLLRKCSKCLAFPVILIARLILDKGYWPWKTHWLAPVYKRKNVSDPGNYRGVRLTAHIGKTIERCIGTTVLPFLEKTNAFGTRQFAYRKQHSARDLLFILTSDWLMAMHLGHKIGIFLSDISGAFDRVRAARLIGKALKKGVGEKMGKFIAGYLEPRIARVVVDGVFSDEFEIADQVFQGTVLGPPFWNLFFADIQDVITNCGAQEEKKKPKEEQRTFHNSVYADDLNAYKEYKGQESNLDIVGNLEKCADEVHRWGVDNQVLFDAGKEHFCILHRDDPYGDVFRLLGVDFDNQLLMAKYCKDLGRRLRSKMQMLLRARYFHSTAQMVNQYKTHVLSLVELPTPAIYHAAPTHLDSIDSVQRSFLKAIGVSEAKAFVEMNLAPLQMRRDLSMLGALHKCAYEVAHADMCKFFPLHKPTLHKYQTRWRPTHNHQLHDFCREKSERPWQLWMKRSAYGLIGVYNELPQKVIDLKKVSLFQRELQDTAKELCKNNFPDWQSIYTPKC
jgi:hypothetical protein